MIRVLKCFVSLTLTYIAQFEESVLHICLETQQLNDYICWTCFVSTASDSRIKITCYADFNIHRLSRRKCYMSALTLTRFLEYVCWSCFVRTASNSRFKILCYADFNIYRSWRRKCYVSVLTLNRLLIICVVLALKVRLVTRVCFLNALLGRL